MKLLNGFSIKHVCDGVSKGIVLLDNTDSGLIHINKYFSFVAMTIFRNRIVTKEYTETCEDFVNTLYQSGLSDFTVQHYRDALKLKHDVVILFIRENGDFEKTVIDI